jgi:hypothetical protein
MSKRLHLHPELEAEAVLGRREAVSAERLVQVIHEVNPTSRGLDREQVARRYRLKAELQSLLVERFSDELEVEPEQVPGMIGLRHRFVGADACHARIDELSDPARSWVRRELDLRAFAEPTAGHAPRPPASAPRGKPSSDRVRSGRKALAEYDYERARLEFEAALGEADPEAAALLLELLVDHLGLYAEALALELPEPIQEREQVRGLLALAAARSGDRRTAERWLRGTRGGRSTEALGLTVRLAVTEGALGEAYGLLARLRERDPGHPELATWERAMNALLVARSHPSQR